MKNLKGMADYSVFRNASFYWKYHVSQCEKKIIRVTYFLKHLFIEKLNSIV